MATQSYTLPRFKAGAPLLEQITAERMNAILDAVERGRVIFGDNITGTRTGGGTIVRTKFEAAAGSTVTGPFTVSQTSVGTPPDTHPALAVEFGLICGITPTLGDVALDATPPPTLALPGAGFSVMLRGHVAPMVGDENFRVAVDEAKIISSADIPEEDLDEEGAFHSFTMVWEGETPEEQDLRSVGHFYIELAAISITTPPGGGDAVAAIAQKFTGNIKTLAVTGSEVIIIA